MNKPLQEREIRRRVTVGAGDVTDPVCRPSEGEVTDVGALSMHSNSLDVRPVVRAGELARGPDPDACRSYGSPANAWLQRIICEPVSLKSHMTNWFAIDS